MANYKQDAYYAPIVRAVENLLREKGFVAPVELFIRMDLLSPEAAEDWRRGRISYLERVIRCNLSKASRILSILRMHAHDSDLKPSLTVYKRWTKGSRPLLRFSKTGVTMLKRLTLVTLFLHVRRAVHLKKERSRLAILRRSCQHRGPACDERPRPKVMKVGGNYVCP